MDGFIYLFMLLEKNRHLCNRERVGHYVIKKSLTNLFVIYKAHHAFINTFLKKQKIFKIAFLY